MNPLKLTISVDTREDLTTEHLFLKVAFENVSDKEVNILRYFTDEKTLPIWFLLSMTSSDGTPVSSIRSGGKISIRGKMEFIRLYPHESFSFRLDVAKLAPDIKEGTYQIKLSYQNQYGYDCFKGRLESNVINVTLARPDSEKKN